MPTLRISRLPGCDHTDLTPLDRALEAFMLERDIPGGALAVSRMGRLIAACGYTLREDPTGPISPTSLFRIASVSKPLTAAAVLQLVDKGKLDLEDSAYEILGLYAPGVSSPERDPRRITLLHLLQHQAGWDRSVSFDPLSIDRAVAGRFGKDLPIAREDIVAFVTERPLDFEPGGRYAYSNYGYLLLGLVVEKVTGRDFAGFVKGRILKPLGIASPRMGRTLPEHRAEGEVTYHSSNPNVFGNVMLAAGGNDAHVAYGGYNLENMVSSGAWIASPVDLVGFACAFDSAGECPLFGEALVRTMFAPPAANRWSDDSYYACGWVVRESPAGTEASHSGCLQGVTSSLRRRPDGINFCALFNRREETSPYSWDADAAINSAIDEIGGRWPDVDLFPASRL